ncbi:MAG: hypothetical protein LBO69_01525, partial [Ignavibacteria bacterium]|nr:hypothetical protein [Ignavibacteria bacterium]
MEYVKSTIIIILFLMASDYSYSQFSGGDGTSASPYLISSLEDLLELNDSTLSSKTNGRYYSLTQNISDTLRQAIGSTLATGVTFNGNFNGNFHTITLGISDTMITGLFCFAQRYSTSSPNVVIKNVIVDGYCTTSGIVGYVGGIAGHTDYTDITNCISFCKNTGNHYTGGIVGMASNCTFINCINVGYVTSRNRANGIVCDGPSSYITNCLNIGNVAVKNNVIYLNGICAVSASITNCFNGGLLLGAGLSSDRISGICRDVINHYSTGYLTTCINTGAIINNGSGVYSSGIEANTSTATTSSNYYDRQMCPYGGINGVDVPGQAEGKLTTNATLTGTALQSILGADDWVYEDSLYPRLKCFDTMWAA